MMQQELLFFVNGQAMQGGSLYGPLAGARFLGARSTAPLYRFYAFGDEFPGLYPAEQKDGVSVAGELYLLSYASLLEEILPQEPRQLELSVIRLEDASLSLSMVARTTALEEAGVVDISAWASWRQYMSGVDTGA